MSNEGEEDLVKVMGKRNSDINGIYMIWFVIYKKILKEVIKFILNKYVWFMGGGLLGVVIFLE